MKERVCELCNGEASLYCVSDSAFLCCNCDSKVHEANFLVARHVRWTVCCICKSFDGNRISGVGFWLRRRICRSCSSDSVDDGLDDSCSSSSSTCISSAESLTAASSKTKKIDFDRRRPTKDADSSSVTDISGEDSSKKKNKTRNLGSRAPAKIDVKVEGILVNWCRKLGLKNSSSVSLASHAFSVGSCKLTALPFRVSLASSLWFSLKACEGRSMSTCHVLKKLEEISGVPAKLILSTESKISRVLGRSQNDQDEGWSECSD